MDSFAKIFTKIIMKKIKIPFNEYDFGIDPKLMINSENLKINLFSDVENFLLSFSNNEKPFYNK
jgi:hypothetical protein